MQRTLSVFIGILLCVLPHPGGPLRSAAQAPAAAPPFGVFETPAEHVPLAGEVGVTGWALDDSGVATVEIYRGVVPGEAADNGLVFLGTATLVSGARPDISTAYPSYPGVGRAGWGYMLLSNMLPNQGNGTFQIFAKVQANDGNTAMMGPRTITVANAVSRSPFGTIDTPAQGQTVCGTVVNFGWALTPAPNSIPINGATIEVYVDSVFRGRPAYNNYRADIAGLFPGYANSGGAVGHLTLDTHSLSNGVHTIAWVVRDSAGNASGIGSRYFTVANTAPNGPSIVTVETGGTRVFVQRRRPDGTLDPAIALVMRGFNWSPHTKGDPPSTLAGQHVKWRDRDLPMMAAAGVTAIRTYHDFGTGPEACRTLDRLYDLGIGVIVQVDSPQHETSADLENIRTVVNAYKNHPAILMWNVGNEWDINNYYGTHNTLAEAAAFTETAAQLIKTLDPHHPVSTVIADPHIPAVHPLSASQFPFLPARPTMEDLVQQLVPSVDVWGVNVYRGNSFQDMFAQWRSITTKPMFIGEYGADSYRHAIAAEDGVMQANWNTRLWDEVVFELSAERIAGNTLGALAMEWNDEWWKNGAPAAHDLTSEPSVGQPDLFNDEEWFGHVDADRAPKPALAALSARFFGGYAAAALNAAPVLRAVSQDDGQPAVRIDVGDRTVYRRSGGAGGGRGITVAVLDEHTGIRLRDVRTFDTWISSGGFQALRAYLDALPAGAILALAIGDEGGFSNPNDANVQLGYQALEALGSTKIKTVGFRVGWAMICVKGKGVLAEAVSNAQVQAVASATVALTLDPRSGLR